MVFIIRKSLLNNTVWNTAGVIVFFVCQWLIIPVTVRLYEGFAVTGNLATAINIANFFQVIAVYNLRAFQVSDVHSEFSDSVYIAARFTTCAAAVLLCIAFSMFSGYTFELVILVLGFMGLRIAETLIDTLHGIAHKHRRLDYVGISLIIRGILTLAVFCVFVYFFSIFSAVLAMIAVTALLGLTYDIPRNRKLAVFTAVSRAQVIALLKRCFPLMLMALIFMLYTSYTRYFIDRIHGAEAMGAYASAITPAVALQFVVSFLFAPLISMFSECVEQKDRRRFNKIFTVTNLLIAAVSIIAVILAYALGPWVLSVIYNDPKIQPYAYLLPAAMLVTGLTAALWYLSIVFTTIRDIKGILYASLSGCAVCLAGAPYFITAYGLQGANYILIACQGVALLFTCIRYVWIQRRIMPDEQH